MNDKTLSIIVKAQDQASRVIEKIGSSTQGMARKVEQASKGMAVLATGAGVAMYGLTQMMGDSIGAANKANAAMTGLNSVARAFGHDANAAKMAAQTLAKDGLMTVGDAATGLKNLLAAGFDLPQAIDLMNAFRDSAAFGRQGSLEFGQAIVSATEGVKNGNSILVDNAGVTKNLSNILVEAGFSAQDLGRATTDTNVRMALYNGILKETNAQQGDADRLAGSFAGKQAQLAAQTTVLQQNLGVALQTAILPFLQAITPVVVGISKWVSENQRLAAAIAIGIVVFLAIITVIGGVIAVVGAAIAIFGSGAGLIIAAVVGIAAAVAIAAGYIITHWNSVKNFFGSLPGWIGGALAALPGIIFGIFNRMSGGALAAIWNMRNQIGGSLSGLVGVVAAAVSGIANVLTAPFQSALGTISGIIGSIKGAISSIQNIGGKAWNAIKGAVPGFSTGGYTGRGGTHEVAGIVHKGEYVVPKSQVNQDTGLPMLGGQTTFNMYGNINLGDASAVDRWFTRLNAQKEMGTLGAGV